MTTPRSEEGRICGIHAIPGEENTGGRGFGELWLRKEERRISRGTQQEEKFKEVKQKKSNIPKVTTKEEEVTRPKKKCKMATQYPQEEASKSTEP